MRLDQTTGSFWWAGTAVRAGGNAHGSWWGVCQAFDPSTLHGAAAPGLGLKCSPMLPIRGGSKRRDFYPQIPACPLHKAKALFLEVETLVQILYKQGKKKPWLGWGIISAGGCTGCRKGAAIDPVWQGVSAPGVLTINTCDGEDGG